LKPLLHVFGLFLPLVCELLASSPPAPLKAQPLPRLVLEFLPFVPLLLWRVTRERLKLIAEEALVPVELGAARHLSPFRARITAKPMLVLQATAFLTHFLVSTADTAYGL
jgi:hypothetical protein